MAYYLESTGQALLDPLINIWNSFVLSLPGILAALVVAIVGYLIGYIVSFALVWVIDKSTLNQKFKKAKLSHSIGHMDLGHVVGSLAKWYIFVAFLAAAVDLLNLGVLSLLLRSFVYWLPSLIVAVVIILFGFIVADYASEQMLKAKKRGVRLAAHTAKALITLFFILTALDQIGINVSLATNTILIIVAAISIAVAVALGISFGNAMKDEAHTAVKWMKKNM